MAALRLGPIYPTRFHANRLL